MSRNACTDVLHFWDGASPFGPQPVAGGNQRGLGAVVGVEFAEDAANVVAHGFFGDVEPLGDLPVGETRREPLQDLSLAPGELREEFPLPARHPVGSGKLPDDPCD